MSAENPLDRTLSPRRNTSTATTIDELVREQLLHFAIDPESDYGRAMARVARRLYEAQASVNELWKVTLDTFRDLDAPDRIARFNAKKFLSFQVAKILDTLQSPFRKSYQELRYQPGTIAAKGPYPIFDNVTALFSATPVIARTATYIYACAEWVEDAFKGEELLHEIYSRLLNPTSISLANYVVDLEAGPNASEYFAWNFSSGMAAIDATLSHLLGRDYVLVRSRNVYGGAFQLIHDWYAKERNLRIAVETFDGAEAEDLERCLDLVEEKHADRLAAGRKVFVFLESPSNPHGDFLDVPGMCRLAHERGLRVVLDATVGTPFLLRPLQHPDPQQRPDFLIHSYTKDMTGTGSTTAGVVIARNADMFVPKGQTVDGVSWENTLFWNVYYVKGAFLHPDSAFEVMQGLRTLEMRMLPKCINTLILARYFEAHPSIEVHSSAVPSHANSPLRERLSFLGLPAPLMTIRFVDVPRPVFQRFFDSLAPTFGHMISLGQSNTIVSCPALTTHSELDDDALQEAGIDATTIRVAVGDEDAADLIRHLVSASRLCLDPELPGFSERFPSDAEADEFIETTYLQVHRDFIRSRRLAGE